MSFLTCSARDMAPLAIHLYVHVHACATVQQCNSATCNVQRATFLLPDFLLSTVNLLSKSKYWY